MGLQEKPTGKWDVTKGWPYLEHTEKERTRIASHPTNYYLENERQWHTQENKQTNKQTNKQSTLPKKQAKNLLVQRHRWTHLGDKKLVQEVKGPKVYIIALRFWARDIVEQCKVC